jgi:NADPH:quinone reductase-like Zn-dependent oxidoreductase
VLCQLGRWHIDGFLAFLVDHADPDDRLGSVFCCRVRVNSEDNRDRPGATRAGAKKRILVTLTGLIEDGKVTPVIDRTFPFHELPDAVTYSEQGHVRGKIAVTV